MPLYKVVPFIGQIRSGENANQVSSQLEEILNREAQNGYVLDQVAEVNIEVKPGCLDALFNKKSSYVKFDQVILKKEK